MKNTFLYIIIAALAVVIVLQRCNNPKPCEAVVSVMQVSDTVYVPYLDTTVHTKPTHIASLPAKPNSALIPSADCDSLNEQYTWLSDDCFSLNIFRETFKKDSSWLELTDTVMGNRIIGRAAKFYVEQKVITNTITNTVTNKAEAKRQVYVGGGISGNKINLINRFEVGLLYKDRKDRMFVVGADMDLTGQVSYGVKSYWKIKLK